MIFTVLNDLRLPSYFKYLKVSIYFKQQCSPHPAMHRKIVTRCIRSLGLPYHSGTNWKA